MSDYDLYGGTPPHVVDSGTSRAAAECVRPSVLTQRQRVLVYLRERPIRGATDEEVQLALDMNPSTQRPRRIELVQKKLVEDSGERRKTASGRSAVVWAALPDVQRVAPQPVDERDAQAVPPDPQLSLL